MKKMKQLATLAMVGVMTMSMVVPAMAAEHTITIGNNGNVTAANHTFKAYQVFTGTIAETETAGSVQKLASIQWGSGVNGDALLAALKADEKFKETFKKCTTADDVATAMCDITTAADIQALCAIISKHVTEVSVSNKTGENTIKVASEGYYFIQDVTENIAKGDAYSDYILQILDDKQINIKTDAPTIEKKIMDGPLLVDKSSASIGEVVYYQVDSVVPDTTNYDNFYYYYMTDTFSAGLTFNALDNVWLDMNDNGVLDAGEELATSDYALYKNGQTIQVAFTNMLATGKKYAGKTLYVNYHATVNEDAVIGESGNTNTIKLSYSNNPTVDYDFDKTGDKEKPGIPKDSSGESTPIGETPWDTVITYLTEVNLTKYADKVEGGKELAGAEFTLTGIAQKTVYGEGEAFVKSETGTYYLLKDGSYTTEAPRTEDVTTMIEIPEAERKLGEGYLATESDGVYEEGTTIIVDGKEYYVVSSKETGIYELHTEKANVSSYASTSQKYEKVENATTHIEDYAVNRVLTTGADGIISFSGLDAGTYTLEETKVPAGYNKCETITFTITVTEQDGTAISDATVNDGKETVKWSEDTKKFTYNVGKFSINIIDRSGAVLPTTGGIGTTIFYTLGSLLTLGAGVVMITRRRLAR